MRKTIGLRKTMVAAVAAGLTAAALCVPAVAFADAGSAGTAFTTSSEVVLPDVGPNEPQKTGGYVTGAATRAAMPALDILGVDSTEESGNFVDTSVWFAWDKPKYFLMACNYNSNLDAYLFNRAAGYDGEGIRAVALNAARAGGGAGPNSSLGAYGDDATDDLVWNLLPDVIVGTGGSTDYDESARRVEKALGLKEGSYNPVGVSYSFNNYWTLAATMDDIAAAVNDTKEMGRYDDSASAVEIATQYREYIYGIMGAIAQEIDAGNVEKKTVALVTNAVDTGDNTYTYTLLSNEASGMGDGTASQNRYLETTVGTLIGDDQKETLSLANNICDSLTPNEDGSYTLTSAQIKSLVASGDIDLILVGGQQSSSNYDNIEGGLDADRLFGNAYYVVENGSNGAMYGVVMNSVENAQNVARILGCLYNGVQIHNADGKVVGRIDQAYLIAYYYSKFMHISDDHLDEVMSEALEGVRNWVAIPYYESGVPRTNACTGTGWDVFGMASTLDLSQAIIDAGYAYFEKSILPS